MNFKDLFRINEIMDENAMLKHHNDELRTQNKQLKADLENVSKNAEKLKIQNTQLADNKNKSGLENDRLVAEITSLKKQIRELTIESEANKNMYRTLRQNITPDMYDAVLLREKVDNLNQQIQALHIEKASIEDRSNRLKAEIQENTNKLVEVKAEVMYQSFGLYTPKYDLTKSEDYKIKLVMIREAQKRMIRNDVAVSGYDQWRVNGSEAQGSKMIKDMKKLLLRAFNNECDDAINNVSYANINISEKKIVSSRETISKLGATMGINITDDYLKSKMEELYLAFEYQAKKQEEKELLRELTEQRKEAEKVQREIDAARRKIEKDQLHFEQAIANINKQIESADIDQKEALLEKKDELEQKLESIEDELREVDQREANAKAGYVYIISNIGSFGEDVYKIGMTRRLDPQDRVDELSTASVPFRFDTHAMIFSEDAPALEAAIHKALKHKRLNLINNRKEFFKTNLDEIKKIVRENFDKTVEFVDIPDAEQYRLSVKKRENGDFD